MEKIDQAVQQVVDSHRQLEAHTEQQVAEHHPHHRHPHHHLKAPADAQPRT